MHLKRGLLAASALAAVMFGSSAFAQEGIEVVTVTAAKRAQNVQDVPISMNVISSTDLNKFNAASLSNLQTSVPSLMITKSPTNVGLFMRGFGTSPANPSSDMAVSVYNDGIWQEKARNLAIDFFDVQRIEVLRGAQGALVGKNTQVGAINIITADPTDAFEGAVTVNYNFDFKGTDTYGYISGPVTDTLSARLAVKFVDQSGWINNLAYNRHEPDTSRYEGRLSLKFQPEQGITDLLKIEYSAWNTQGNTQLPGDPTLPVSTANKLACCTKTDSGPLGKSVWDKQHGWRLSNKLDVDLPDGYTLTSLSGFTAYDSDSNGAGSSRNPSGFGTDFIERYQGGSTELRLTSPAGDNIPVDWIVGVYTDYSRYTIDDPIDYSAAVAAFTGGGIGGGLTLHDNENTFSYSAYASATWHVIDHLRLIGNLRFTRQTKSATYVQYQRYGARSAATGNNTVPFTLVPPPNTVLRTQAGNIGSNFFDPSATIQYDVTDDVMVYASWAHGSKGAAFDLLNRTVLAGAFVFKPEISTNWEAGIKSKWFDDMVTFNLTGFWMKVKNMQVSGFSPVFLSLVTSNVGEAESKGIELELDVRPVDGLSINNSVNYIDARYTNFPGAACLTAASPYFSVNGPTCPASPSGNNLKGVPLQYVPAWSGNTSIDYVVPVMDSFKLDITGSAEWRSKVWLNPGYILPYGLMGGYTKFNLRAAFGAEDDSWTIAVVGKNITNTLTTSAAATLWNLESGKPAESEIFLDEPRNISIQASLRF